MPTDKGLNRICILKLNAKIYIRSDVIMGITESVKPKPQSEAGEIRPLVEANDKPAGQREFCECQFRSVLPGKYRLYDFSSSCCKTKPSSEDRVNKVLTTHMTRVPATVNRPCISPGYCLLSVDNSCIQHVRALRMVSSGKSFLLEQVLLP